MAQWGVVSSLFCWLLGGDFDRQQIKMAIWLGGQKTTAGAQYKRKEILKLVSVILLTMPSHGDAFQNLPTTRITFLKGWNDSKTWRTTFPSQLWRPCKHV